MEHSPAGQRLLEARRIQQARRKEEEEEEKRSEEERLREMAAKKEEEKEPLIDLEPTAPHIEDVPDEEDEAEEARKIAHKAEMVRRQEKEEEEKRKKRRDEEEKVLVDKLYLPTKTELHKLKMGELRDQLMSVGLGVEGTKAELVLRLFTNYQDQYQDELEKEAEEEEAEVQAKKKEPDKQKKLDKEEEDVDPQLAKVEKELNEAKFDIERTEQQLKKVAENKKKHQQKVAALEKEKVKLLHKVPSPANTEEFKTKMRREVDKKKKKGVHHQSDSDSSDQDNDASTASPINSQLFGLSRLDRIKAKLEKVHNHALEALDNLDDREVLKSARDRCFEAQKYLDNNIDKVSHRELTQEASDQVELLNSSVDDVILELNKGISQYDRNTRHGLKPDNPKFDPSYPSRFLSFSKAFNQAFKNQPDSIKITCYKQSIVGTEKQTVIRLLAGVSNDFSEVERIMQARFGDVVSLLPGERRKIEDLQTPKSDRAEESNLLAILEFHHLLKSHNATRYFDRGLQYLILVKLQSVHKYDLLNRKPENLEQFIKRLEQYLSDINELARVVGHQSEPDEGGESGHKAAQDDPDDPEGEEEAGLEPAIATVDSDREAGSENGASGSTSEDQESDQEP